MARSELSDVYKESDDACDWEVDGGDDIIPVLPAPSAPAAPAPRAVPAAVPPAAASAVTAAAPSAAASAPHYESSHLGRCITFGYILAGVACGTTLGTWRAYKKLRGLE